MRAQKHSFGGPAPTADEFTNLDVNKAYHFRLEGEGMRPAEFSVFRYQWIKDGSTGDFNVVHKERLIHEGCENWYSYSWARSEEKSFETEALCNEFVRGADGQATRCLCRVKVPEPEEAEKPANTGGR